MSQNNGHHKHGLVNYRILPQDLQDWTRLRHFMNDVKGYIPPPALGVAAVAEDPEGKIVGGLVLQMCPYMGPLKIDPEWTGEVDYITLKKLIDGVYKPSNQGVFGPLIIQGYIVLTDSEAIARMAEAAGMKRHSNCITLVQTIDEKNGVPTT